MACMSCGMAFFRRTRRSREILGIWFPIMAFVAIGFQHVVANMFVIPAAILQAHSPGAVYRKHHSCFIGNVIGGAVFVGLIYLLHILRKTAPERNEAGIMNKGQIRSINIKRHFIKDD
ncbi:formate/nitrite transporter family protein [Bacillus licheniformis]|nr:formate/nitrite transporter family protein [Bacillus licheniformis]